jgi:hypothetical protein
MRRRREPEADANHHHNTRYNAADFQSAMHGPEPRMVELAYLQGLLGPPEVLMAQGQPLVGTVYTTQGPMEVAEALSVFGVGKVVYRFGTWVVTDDGIACLVHNYPLTSTRLREQQDWARHLAEQDWANLWDFLRAFTVAAQIGSLTPSPGPVGDGTRPS